MAGGGDELSVGEHNRRWLWPGSLVAVGLLVAAFWLLIGTGLLHPKRHEDGGGPLGSEGGPARVTQALDPLAGRYDAWTYGIPLCMVSGMEPAVLETVGPTATVGSGFRFLGASFREFDYVPMQHSPILSTVGYPPPTDLVPDLLRDARGAVVTARCTHPPVGLVAELLVGLGRVGSDGGGWEGVDVTYKVGGDEQVLHLQRNLLICGISVPECPPAH